MPNNTSHIELRSEEVQEVLSAVPNWMIRWGNTLVLFLILGLLAITWVVKYPDVIAAEAMITTQFPPQKEYAKISGKVEAILVTDNQLIAAHTPLAIIENSANFKDVFSLQSIVDTIVFRNSHFHFPFDQLPFLELGDLSSDYAQFENSYHLYLLNKKWQPYSSEAHSNRQLLLELKSNLKNLEAQQEMNAEELLLKKAELERQQALFEQGLISAQDFENKQLEQLQANRNFKDRGLAISQTKQTINAARLTSKNTIMNHSKEEQVLWRNVIQAFNQLKKAIKDWELKYVLKSNIDGQVSFLNLWTENQSINVGDLVFIIIPQKNNEYLAKLKIPSLNSGKIKMSQSVNVSLENYPNDEYGMLKGKIKKISLVTDQEGFYVADVALPAKLVTNYGKEINFKQEMRGQAEIITEELRLMERFFYQLKEIFAE